MNKSKHQITIIVYTIIIVIASCVNPEGISIIEVPEIEDTPATVEETEIITPEIDPEEEIIEMTMIPIEQYPAYAVNEQSKVFGLNGNSRDVVVLKDSEDQIHPFSDFFILSGSVYFTVKGMDTTDPENPVEKEYYFQQTGDTIAEISELPVKPESIPVEMGVTPWSIISGKYEDTDISSVKQEVDETNKPVKNFLKIDGYYVDDGLWFSVPDGLTGAEKGLYFWAESSLRIGNPVEYCRIWK